MSTFVNILSEKRSYSGITMGKSCCMEGSDMTKLLITYFGAFEGVEKNPTREIAENVGGALAHTHPDVDVTPHELPVSFVGSSSELTRVLAETSADAVLSLGVAVGREKISIERVAINLDDARIADNDGDKAQDRPIRPDAPAAYFTRLPYRHLVTEMTAQNLPVEISDTAGTFVCNHVFYELMHALASTEIPGGFVHIPATRPDTETASHAANMTAHPETGGIEGREVPTLPVNTVSNIVQRIAEAMV